MKESVAQIDLRVIKTEAEKNTLYAIKASVIHILFTTSNELIFDMGPRSISLSPFSSYLFYEQNGGIQLPVRGMNAELIALEIPIKTLHVLVSTGTDELNFEATNIFEKERYHKLLENNNAINECLDAIIEDKNPLMREARKFELLSLYFSNQDVKTYKCPFLNQKENVVKVRKAKEILISDLKNAPTIKELSKEIGLNEHNLKTGFKEIYSKPIHTFLKDHRMNTARGLIESKDHRINEIAEKVGYSNVSHFIDAFKKKFGLTPKQYELKQMQ